MQKALIARLIRPTQHRPPACGAGHTHATRGQRDEHRQQQQHETEVQQHQRWQAHRQRRVPKDVRAGRCHGTLGRTRYQRVVHASQEHPVVHERSARDQRCQNKEHRGPRGAHARAEWGEELTHVQLFALTTTMVGDHKRDHGAQRDDPNNNKTLSPHRLHTRCRREVFTQAGRQTIGKRVIRRGFDANNLVAAALLAQVVARGQRLPETLPNAVDRVIHDTHTIALRNKEQQRDPGEDDERGFEQMHENSRSHSSICSGSHANP